MSLAQLVAVITAILGFASSRPATDVHRVDLAFGGTWRDAEKCRANKEDDGLCWAAAAANVLAWTGWGTDAGFKDEDAILRYFAEHWTDHPAGSPREAWRWWFTGQHRGKGGAQVDVLGGGFWKEAAFPRYDWESPRGALFRGIGQNMLKRDPYALKTVLDEGYGVAIQIVRPLKNGEQDSHMITLWGYRSAKSRRFRGVFVTDSDDGKDVDQAASAPNRLRYHPVVLRDGMWCFKHNGHTWKILAAYALARRPGHQR